MPRVSADLHDHDFKALSETAIVLRRSKASLIREAVAFFRGDAQPVETPEWLEAGVGLWKVRTDIGDAVGNQRRERAVATRPWDYDYEVTRAEFPDLFNEDDDRQRRIFLEMIARKSSEKRDNKANGA